MVGFVAFMQISWGSDFDSIRLQVTMASYYYAAGAPYGQLTPIAPGRRESFDAQNVLFATEMCSLLTPY